MVIARNCLEALMNNVSVQFGTQLCDSMSPTQISLHFLRRWGPESQFRSDCVSGHLPAKHAANRHCTIRSGLLRTGIEPSLRLAGTGLDLCQHTVQIKAEKKYLEITEMWCWRRTAKTSWTDRMKNWKSLTKGQKMEWRKVNCNGHIFSKKCILKQVIEERREGKRRRWRRPKHLLEDVKETRGYWRLKGNALERTLWRTHFGWGCFTFLRQTSDDDDDDDECSNRPLDPPSLLSWESHHGSVWSCKVTCI